MLTVLKCSMRRPVALFVILGLLVCWALQLSFRAEDVYALSPAPSWSRLAGGTVSVQTETALMNTLPAFIEAIKTAENNPRNHGVLSVKTDNPTQVIQDSLLNNYARWSAGLTPAPWIDKKPRKFIDFMHSRWAPIGASNDPKGLNRYWAGNVRGILKRNIDKSQYKLLVDLDLI